MVILVLRVETMPRDLALLAILSLRVGWVERSETTFANDLTDGFRSAQPILRAQISSTALQLMRSRGGIGGIEGIGLIRSMLGIGGIGGIDGIGGITPR
jgi:hypothetical protein